MNTPDHQFNAEDLAEQLGQWASKSNRDEKAFIQALLRDHRTIQQNIGRVIVELLVAWSAAYESKEFDLRNEGTVKFANDCVGDGDLPHLPYV